METTPLYARTALKAVHSRLQGTKAREHTPIRTDALRASSPGTGRPPLKSLSKKEPFKKNNCPAIFPHMRAAIALQTLGCEGIMSEGVPCQLHANFEAGEMEKGYGRLINMDLG